MCLTCPENVFCCLGFNFPNLIGKRYHLEVGCYTLREWKWSFFHQKSLRSSFKTWMIYRYRPPRWVSQSDSTAYMNMELQGITGNYMELLEYTLMATIFQGITCQWLVMTCHDMLSLSILLLLLWMILMMLGLKFIMVY